VLREPLIQLLFERGQFTVEATRAVAAAMAAYAFGLPAIAIYYVVTRTFYALQDMATPVRVGVFMIALNAVLDYLLMRWLGAPGIALATAIVSTLNVGALLWILRGRFSSLEGRRLARTTVRIGVAAVLSAVAMLSILQILPAGAAFAGAVLRMTIGAAVGGAVYLAVCRLLSVEELRVVRELIGDRPRTNSTA
jgi:putative peptidoglycan lipid II flippase